MSKEIKVKVRGVCAMLQHRRSIEDEKNKVKKTSGEKDYSKEWKKAVYKDSRGCYIPADHIQAALVKSGVDFKVTGKRGKTFKNLINAALVVTPDKLYLGKKKPDFIDEHFVNVSRNQILRSRPGFNQGWQTEFTLLLLDEQLPKGVVKEILVNAGKFVGIGDWRPRYGRFEVMSFR